MIQRLSWLGLLILTALAIYLACLTDINYLAFIRGTDRVQIVVRQGELELDKDRARINFTVQVSNPSQVKLWLEALNYQVSINGAYAGYQYMPEGEILIPPGGQNEVRLTAELRADYFKLLLNSLEQEGKETVVSISGRARMKFNIGRSGMKAFYPVGGVIWERRPAAEEGGKKEGEGPMTEGTEDGQG